MDRPRRRKPLTPQLRIVAIYVIFSGLWISFSDILVGLLARDPSMATRMSVAKGFVFVAVTAALLYILIARSARRSASISEQLARSDARFRSYIEHSPLAILVFDEAGRCVDFNPAAAALARREPAEMSALSIGDFVDPADRGPAMEDLSALMRDGVARGELVIRRSTGETLTLAASGVRIEGPLALVFCQDISAAVESREAIRASEERYRTLFSNMLEGFAYCEMVHSAGEPVDFLYLGVNAAFGTLTGLVDVVGRRVSEVIPGFVAAYPQVMAAYARVAAGGAPERIEVFVSSIERWLDISAYSTEKGRFIAVFDDITERKKADRDRETTLELLRICNGAASERDLMRELTLYFKRLTGCGAVGIRIRKGDDFPYFETRGFSEEFVALETSLCARDTGGGIIRDADGTPLLECMCGNVIRGRVDPGQPFFTGNGSFWSGNTSLLLATTTDGDRQTRTRNRCNGMGYETVVLIPLRTQGQTFGLIQFNDERVGHLSREDVSELEGLVMYVAIALAKLEADEALREASRFSQQIISSAEEGIVVLDAGMRYTLWNRFMERLTGIPENEVLGRLPWEVFPTTETSGFVERIRLTLRGTAPHPADFELRIPSTGRHGWVSESSVPLRNGRGNVIGVITTVHDISERQEAAARLRETNEKLLQAEKMEAVGRLAGGVAHDFNNILTAIYGYCDILRARTAADTPERGYVDEVRRAATRAASLTQQLLAFSRRQTLQPRIVDLNELLRNLKKMLGRMIGEDIEIRFDPGEDTWAVRADPARIEQVVMNLAVNARDAMPKGGLLTIRTRNELIDAAFTREHPDISEGDHVRITVSDGGVGMDAETMSHLFEPFFTTKEIGKGTGLGLSTVYGIVKQSGGGIVVESIPGKGTTFHVYIPRAARMDETPRAQPAVPRRTDGGEKILLVEDDEAVRSLVTLVLRDHGYTVVPAADGAEALKIARRSPGGIDLLITDVVMPGMDGPRLVETLRAERPYLKAAYISGYTNDMVAYQDVVDKGLELIEKPIDPVEFLHRIRAILDGKTPPVS